MGQTAISTTRPNPLPQFDANAALQRASVHALYTIVRPADLLLRGEQHMDYGVDATFEVLIDERATNYTSQIQMKAIQTADLNRDGSISKAIDVSNFNYLLNGQCPIYLLYAADQNRFWFVWAADVLRRLELENPKWRDQATITIRFSSELNDAALQEIHSRIARESQSRREILDTLARYASHETAKFAVNPKTFGTKTAEEAYQCLLRHGFTLVSRGFWREVMEMSGLLSFAQMRRPKISLTLAYAHYFEGRYLTALASCGEAYMRVAELTPGDRDVLDTIRDACECSLGKITREEYTKRQVAAANSPGASIQRRINSVRFQLLSERDDAQRASLFSQLQSLASEALADTTGGEEFKLQTRIQLLYAEGCQCRMAVNKGIALLNVQVSLGTSWAVPDPEPLLQALSAMSEWDGRMQRLIRDTEAAAIPWLRAEARRNALLIRTEMLGFQRFHAKFMGGGSLPSQSEARSLLTEATAVEELFKTAGDIAGEMRAKIAAADIHEIIGDLEAAKKVAEEVKVVADALSLEEIGALALQHLNGTTVLQEFEASAQRRRDEGPDFEMASMSDAEIDFYAERCLGASQLPRERLQVIRRDVEAMKLISVERLNWCRHLQQIQNLFHSRHSLTAYAADPERFCKCEKHGYESIQGAVDPVLVIARFKTAYCEGCVDRKPRISQDAGPNNTGR